jgi:hypothetical protein
MVSEATIYGEKPFNPRWIDASNASNSGSTSPTDSRDDMSSDPVLIAYAAQRSAKANRTIWRRIGEAYPHAEGAGLTVVLDAVPLDGRIILLERDHADDQRLSSEAKRVRKREVPIGTRHE